MLNRIKYYRLWRNQKNKAKRYRRRILKLERSIDKLRKLIEKNMVWKDDGTGATFIKGDVVLKEIKRMQGEN